MSKSSQQFELGTYRPYHLTFACAVPINAYRKGSLSLSGAILAGVFAVITLVLSPTLVFAVSLLTFFFIGSKATKYKAGVKASLEESEHEVQSRDTRKKAGSDSDDEDQNTKKINRKKKDLSSGNRDAFQVACNGLVGTLACVAWMSQFGVSFSYSASEAIPCPVSEHVGNNQEMRMSNALIFTAVGFWAACMGDTLASELGMLATTKPILVTSGRRVPPGTNGGITAWGTFVSGAGGALIALAALLVLIFETNTCYFSLDSHASFKFCSTFVGMGIFSGLVGSLLDSLLGATVQETLYSETSKRIVHSKNTTNGKDRIVRIQGRNIVSNNAVNAISSTVTAFMCGWIGWNLS